MDIDDLELFELLLRLFNFNLIEFRFGDVVKCIEVYFREN